MYFSLRSTPDQNGTPPAKTQDFTGLPMPANLACQCTETGFNACILYREPFTYNVCFGFSLRLHTLDPLQYRRCKPIKMEFSHLNPITLQM